MTRKSYLLFSGDYNQEILNGTKATALTTTDKRIIPLNIFISLFLKIFKIYFSSFIVIKTDLQLILTQIRLKTDPAPVDCA